MVIESGLRLIPVSSSTLEHIHHILCQVVHFRLLLFAMIRSVLKSFKVPDVEVVTARMSNESALSCMTDSTPNLGQT